MIPLTKSRKHKTHSMFDWLRTIQRLVMIAGFLSTYTSSLAQDDVDGWNFLFDLMCRVYKSDTNDSIQGVLSADNSESRANELFDSYQYKESIPFWSKTISRYPTDWNYFRRGISYFEIGDYKSAVVDLTKAIQLKSERQISPWWVGMGVRKRDDQKYWKSCNISLVYQYIDAYFYRAEVKVQLDDMRGAISDVGHFFVNMDSNIPRRLHMEQRMHYVAGYCHYRLQEWQQAIDELNKSISLDDDSAEAHYLLGLCLLNMNKKKEACLSLSRAGELGYMDAYDLIKSDCN